MKRISFFGIVLCALLLTMGASSLLAQSGAITLKKVVFPVFREHIRWQDLEYPRAGEALE